MSLYKIGDILEPNTSREIQEQYKYRSGQLSPNSFWQSFYMGELFRVIESDSIYKKHTIENIDGTSGTFTVDISLLFRKYEP
jgi:hypothetical protein